MNLLIFASTLILALILSSRIKKSNNSAEKRMEAFFEKENKANFVRKKNLDNLPYITIPEEFFTYSLPLEHPRAKDAFDYLCHLKSCKIVNFTGISNTDLKLEYGTANITVLSEYDQNYTSLVRSLQTLGESCYDNGQLNEAAKLLEFALDTGTDISKSYILLARIYSETNQFEKKNRLVAQAKKLNSVMTPSILRSIEEFLPEES